MELTILAIPLIAGLLLLAWRFLSQRRRTSTPTDNEKDTPEKPATDPYQAIEPLHDFDWSKTTPSKVRPFKPKYHLTMALEDCPLSELIENDDTYLDRIRLRKQLMDDHPREIYQCNRVCEESVAELYQWMFGSYLPQRFPTMYRTVDGSGEKGGVLGNLVTGEHIPLRAPASGEEALYALGKNVDTDMLLLLPSSTAADGSPVYHLQAFVTCFPSGFATQDKLGLPLSGIHKPVPGYKAKLEKSMDRFFARLECGKAVKRANWTVTTHAELYTQGGNHLYEDGSTAEVGGNGKTLDVSAPDLEAVVEQQRKEVRIEDCRLRCERQTLHRLPGTKALVFMFKTYQYRLEDVKAEGAEMAEALAQAVEGMAGGSVPEMAYYKRQVVWGEKVAEFLRS